MAIIKEARDGLKDQKPAQLRQAEAGQIFNQIYSTGREMVKAGRDIQDFITVSQEETGKRLALAEEFKKSEESDSSLFQLLTDSLKAAGIEPPYEGKAKVVLKSFQGEEPVVRVFLVSSTEEGNYTPVVFAAEGLDRILKVYLIIGLVLNRPIDERPTYPKRADLEAQHWAEAFEHFAHLPE